MIKPALNSALAKFGIGLVCLPLVLFTALPNSSTLLYTWPFAFYGQLLLLAPIFLLGWYLCSKHPISWRREWLVFGGMALAIGLSVICSTRSRVGLESALYLFSGLSLSCLVAVHIISFLQTDAAPQRLLRIIGLMFMLPLFVGLICWLKDWKDNVDLPHSLRTLFTLRNPFPFGHWNYTGGFTLLVLPWILVLSWMERGRWRIFWLFCSAFTTIMFFSASSRGAVLGAVAAFISFFSLLIFSRKISRRQLVIYSIPIVVVALAVLASNPRIRAVIASPATASQPNEGDVQRISMMQGGWLLAKQRILIGHGPGTTPLIYPTVRGQLVGGVETSFQLHNGPLQLLVDHGLFGLGWAIGIAILLIHGTWRWLKAPPSTLRTFALASSVALFGYGVVFATDYQLKVVAITFTLGLEAGLIMAYPINKSTSPKPVSRWAGITLFVLASIILFLLTPIWYARKVYWEAWLIDSPAQILSHLERAVKISPDNPFYLNQLALKRARLAESEANAPTAAAEKLKAREELTRSLEIDSAQEPVLAALGWLWIMENSRKAEGYFRSAIQLLPDRDTVHFGLALCLLNQKENAKAVDELALECLADPVFITTPVWTQEPFKTLRQPVLARLQADYVSASNNPKGPAWRKPYYTYASAFLRWWLGGQLPSESELIGAQAHQQRFFRHLRQIPQEPTFLPASWELLENALQTPDKAENILNSGPHRPSKAALDGALARLANKPVDLAALLRGPSSNNTGFVEEKINRGHYAIMNNNIDGPGYEDLAPRVADAFIREYAASLFPLNSSIPGPVMLDLMAKP